MLKQLSASQDVNVKLSEEHTLVLVGSESWKSSRQWTELDDHNS